MDRCVFRAATATLLLGLVAWHPAGAVPSYARQLKMECSGCHTRFPQLNAFGRAFKLGGYTAAAVSQIEGQDTSQEPVLSLNSLPPLSLMFQTSYTHLSTAEPDKQNDNIQFPQALSLFLAGKITSTIGTFLQVTYDQEGNSFGLDNTDIRFASNFQLGGGTMLWGITLNNNPTVEDLWNSTPAWGFPWATSATAPTPGASPAIVNLGLNVAGIGTYAMWNDLVYGAVTIYRSAKLGEATPNSDSTDTISGVAPYWRLALQHGWGKNYLEVGTYGIEARLIPSGVTGTTNDYTDIAGDFQYERTMGHDAMLTVHGTYLHEHQDLKAAYENLEVTQPGNDLNTIRADVGYIRGSWSAVAGYFRTTGTAIPGQYPPNPVDGSRIGSPDSSGFIVQGGYFPWRNVQLQLQYTAYNTFNGSHADYDGSGRSAPDNNTLYALAWFVW